METNCMHNSQHESTDSPFKEENYIHRCNQTTFIYHLFIVSDMVTGRLLIRFVYMWQSIDL